MELLITKQIDIPRFTSEEKNAYLTPKPDFPVEISPLEEIDQDKEFSNDSKTIEKPHDEKSGSSIKLETDEMRKKINHLELKESSGDEETSDPFKIDPLSIRIHQENMIKEEAEQLSEEISRKVTDEENMIKEEAEQLSEEISRKVTDEENITLEPPKEIKSVESENERIDSLESGNTKQVERDIITSEDIINIERAIYKKEKASRERTYPQPQIMYDLKEPSPLYQQSKDLQISIGTITMRIEGSEEKSIQPPLVYPKKEARKVYSSRINRKYLKI
jgi:hypothetical protein